MLFWDLVLKSSDLLGMNDFSTYFNSGWSNVAQEFTEPMMTVDLCQMIFESTHVADHILDFCFYFGQNGVPWKNATDNGHGRATFCVRFCLSIFILFMGNFYPIPFLTSLHYHWIG